MGSKPKKLSGSVFGRLTAVRPVGRTPGRAVLWECLCECGTLVNVSSIKLNSGHTKSCGCLFRDVIGAGGTKNRVHGHSNGTPTYRSWASMKTRCLNPNHKDYFRWGGRGITVCERWKSFANFLADMGERPEGMTLDRYPNNDGNYEPGNCRWATWEQQASNRRIK